MHYYTKNIADFNNATRHLTRQERSIYSDLLELQYDLEHPIPDDMDWVCRRILAFSESERTDVERMLNEYFDSVEQGFSNARAEREINHFIGKREKAIAAGRASGEARKRNKKPAKTRTSNITEQTLNGRLKDVEPTNNQELITISKAASGKPEPAPPKKSKKKTPILLKTYMDNCKADGVDLIPDTDPIFKYAKDIKLDHEFLYLCWYEFADRHINGSQKGKKQADWKATFRNCVRGNWYKLWWLNPEHNGYQLTTTGQQAKRNMEAKAA